MEPIYIPQLLQLPEQAITLDVQDYLPDLETLTPIQGWIKISHKGTYLEVVAQADTIVTLTCDRCLQQYNHRLSIHPTELIWLEEIPEDPNAYPLERELTLEELVETLPPQGYFQPSIWLYEQLCLELPHRKLCDKNCEGIPIDSTENAGNASPLGDRRWASLEALKKQLLN